jgi:hypothetical protein
VYGKGVLSSVTTIQLDANQAKAKLDLAYQYLRPIKKVLTCTVPAGPTQAFLAIHRSAHCLLRVVVTLQYL